MSYETGAPTDSPTVRILPPISGGSDADGAGADGTETATATADTTAGSLNTDQANANGQPMRGFHDHPDWQRMVSERKQDRQLIAELNQRLQGIDQRTQPQPAQPSDEEMQAADALKRLMSLHPELKGLLDAPKSAQDVAQLKQMVQQLVGQQRTGWVAAGKKEIATAATRLGVDAGRLEKTVLGFLADDPALYQRFMQNGDASAITEVLKDIEDNVFGPSRRSATAGLAQQKLTTAKLPPRAAGGLPGEPGRQTLEPGKEREYRDSMHSRAIAKVRELMG